MTSSKIKFNSDVKHWFALLANEKATWSSALLQESGREAVQKLSQAQILLSLPQSTPLDVLDEKIKEIQKLNIPLTWLASHAIYSNQEKLLFVLKKESGKTWNTWASESLWDERWKSKDEIELEINRENATEEKRWKRLQPFVISKLFYQGELIKPILEEKEWDPVLPLSREKNTHYLYALSNLLHYQNFDTAQLVWEDGRVQKSQENLIHALAHFPSTMISDKDNLWVSKILNVIDLELIYQPYEFFETISDKKNHSVLYSLLKSTQFANPFRWPILKEKVDFSKLMPEERTNLLDNLIKDAAREKDSNSTSKKRRELFIDMALVIFKASFPLENFTCFSLEKINQNPKEWLENLSKTNGWKSMVEKGQIIEEKIDYKKACSLILNQDPTFKALNRFFERHQKKHHKESFEEMVSLFKKEFFLDQFTSTEKIKNLKQNALWYNKNHKWLEFVKESDRNKVLTLCQKIEKIYDSELDFEEKMDQIKVILSLSLNTAENQVAKKEKLRI